MQSAEGVRGVPQTTLPNSTVPGLLVDAMSYLPSLVLALCRQLLHDVISSSGLQRDLQFSIEIFAGVSDANVVLETLYFGAS